MQEAIHHATDAHSRTSLLHRGYPEPAVRQFLRSLAQLWLRVTLNPLRRRDQPVTDPAFDERVLTLALKSLGAL